MLVRLAEKVAEKAEERRPLSDTYLLTGAAVLAVSASVAAYFYLASGDSDRGAPPVQPKAVTVEDVDEDDEDEGSIASDKEAEGDKVVNEEELETLTKQYDDAKRLASKFNLGQAYDKAAQKFTEAIELASHVPAASKEMTVLYQNRSAMYERMQEYDKSLSDISIVLTMDPNHQKARVRLARIYEVRGLYQKALDEFIHGMFLYRARNEEFPHEKNIEQICRKLGSIRAGRELLMIRNSDKKPLPSQTYCRTFIENFPAVHNWKLSYSNSNVETKREELVNMVDAAASNDDLIAKLDATLKLISLDISQENYMSAFDLLATIKSVKATDVDPISAALIQEWIGTEQHLKCNLDLATASYKRSLQLNDRCIDTNLKLASLYLDLGEKELAEEIYNGLLKRANDLALSNLEKAWVFVHSSSVWLTRDKEFKYPPNAVKSSITSIDTALDLCKTPLSGSVEENGRQAVRFVALMKSVHILTQVKAHLNEFPTQEENKRNKASIAECKSIFPKKLSVMMLEADHLQMEGNVKDALVLLDEAVKIASSGKDNKSIVDVSLIKASALNSQAYAVLQNPHRTEMDEAGAQATFMEVDKLYKDALETDGQAIEVMAQYSQFKSMIMGDFEGAVKLLDKALPLARSSDEMQELCQLLIMNESQARTVALLRENASK